MTDATLGDFVGRTFATVEGVDPVSRQAVRQLLEALDWDWPTGDVAPDGSPVVPLSTYLTFAMPAYREPGTPLREGMLPPFPFHDVPVPGARTMGTTVEVEAGPVPMRIGDRLTSEWTLQDVRPARTRVGEGRFLRFETRFTNQDGAVVAVERTTLLNFDPVDEGPGPGAASSPVEHDLWAAADTPGAAAGVGALLHDVLLPVGVQRQALIHAANRDFAPIHHDPAAAAEIGAPRPVLNTMSLLSLTERLITDNFGAGSRALRLGPLRLHRPTPSGSLVRVRARVTGVAAREGGSVLELDVVIGTDQGGPTVSGTAVAAVPGRLGSG
jgi:acyl dehydratase